MSSPQSTTYRYPRELSYAPFDEAVQLTVCISDLVPKSQYVVPCELTSLGSTENGEPRYLLRTQTAEPHWVAWSRRDNDQGSHYTRAISSGMPFAMVLINPVKSDPVLFKILMDKADSKRSQSGTSTGSAEENMERALEAKGQPIRQDHSVLGVGITLAVPSSPTDTALSSKESGTKDVECSLLCLSTRTDPHTGRTISRFELHSDADDGCREQAVGGNTTGTWIRWTDNPSRFGACDLASGPEHGGELAKAMKKFASDAACGRLDVASATALATALKKAQRAAAPVEEKETVPPVQLVDVDEQF